MRDIEASINTFFNSIATNFNMVGYNEEILKEYVPALVYTMYDGYYIYSPFINTLPIEDAAKGENDYPNNTKITGLKPYIHYSMRYVDTGIDVVITYSLDNYIAIQGTIDGNPVNDSGYVIDNISNVDYNTKTLKYREIEIGGEPTLQEYIGNNNDTNNLYNYVKVNGVKYYQYKPAIDGKSGWFTILNGEKYGGQPDLEGGTNYSAFQYYADAYEFGKRLENYGIKNLKTSNVQIDEVAKKDEKFGNYTIFSGGSDSIEEPDSNFNQHRLAVIRYTIEKNLSIAIANYNNYEGAGKANFAMPELKEDEWDKILNNISIISFLQGLNIGGKVYNGYSIITNTKNKEVVTEDSIYITTADNIYHNVREKDLNDNGNLSTGVLNIDFERNSKIRNDGQMEYYYPRKDLGSYTSIVTQTDVTDTDNIYDYLEDKDNLAIIYYTALGRERKSSYKTITNPEENISDLILLSLPTPDLELSKNYTNYMGSNYTILETTPNEGGISSQGKTKMSISATFKNTKKTIGTSEQIIFGNPEHTGWALILDKSANKLIFEIHDQVTCWRQECAIDSNKINLNETYHVVGTYDGNEIKMYLNGTLLKTISLPGITITQRNDLNTIIGANPRPTGNAPNAGFFYGNVYDVKVYYDDVLNQNHVNILYNQQKTEYGF